MKRSYFKKKKTEWDKVRAKLKPRFEKAGIICCELRYKGCARDNFLGFAHGVKRRYLSKFAEIGSVDHIETVILSCNLCHDVIEGASDMSSIVLEIIQKRRIQP